MGRRGEDRRAPGLVRERGDGTMTEIGTMAETIAKTLEALSDAIARALGLDQGKLVPILVRDEGRQAGR